MTEQPNTAAIRAEWGEGWPGVEVLIPLCDALDAARAERDDLAEEADQWAARSRSALARAEAAEARIREYEEKLTRSHDDREAAEARADVFLANLRDAEARIATALTELHLMRDVTNGAIIRKRVYRTLTEGTSQ